MPPFLANLASIWQVEPAVENAQSPGNPLFIREAGVGVEPTHRGFADLGLPTWLPRRARCEGVLGSRTSGNRQLVRAREMTGRDGKGGLAIRQSRERRRTGEQIGLKAR